MKVLEFRGLPSMVGPFIRVLRSRQPLLAPAGVQGTPLRFVSHQVRVKPGHLARYRQVCGVAPSAVLPPAYLHVLAMPLHLQLFVHAQFPVKVLGLVHLRNVIRLIEPVLPSDELQLSLDFEALRETDSGQEYDLITRAHVGTRLVWEEVSTMLARRHTPGKRPSIERAQRVADAIVHEQTLSIAANTGRRYAWVSGDLNPIHLFDRTAQVFQFKQCVAHGMWSLARCLGQATLPEQGIELDAQFKLPVYLPSDVVCRQQRCAQGGSDMTLSTPKGDRLHLLITERPLKALQATR